MLKDKTLIIVDMQNYFLMEMTSCASGYERNIEVSRRSKLIRNINRAIKMFKDAKLPIVTVEYDIDMYEEDGNYLPSDLTTINVLKENDDGGAEVFWKMRNKNYPMNAVMVGINMAACVCETANSLGWHINKWYKSMRSVTVLSDCSLNVYDHLTAEESFVEAAFNERYVKLGNLGAL